jgi:hypothetical protein
VATNLPLKTRRYFEWLSRCTQSKPLTKADNTSISNKASNKMSFTAKRVSGIFISNKNLKEHDKYGSIPSKQGQKLYGDEQSSFQKQRVIAKGDGASIPHAELAR